MRTGANLLYRCYFTTIIMANKELAKRQKLTIRVEPSQKALKARNPIAPGARQRIAKSDQKTGTSARQLQHWLLKKALSNDDDK